MDCGSRGHCVGPDDEIAARDAQCQNPNEEHFGAGIFGEVDK
jgi:hypothetical protein